MILGVVSKLKASGERNLDRRDCAGVKIFSVAKKSCGSGSVGVGNVVGKERRNDFFRCFRRGIIKGERN